MKDKWLQWASKLQSVAQAGLTLEAGFFDAGNLPELSDNRNTCNQINMCFEAKKNKVFETIFD